MHKRENVGMKRDLHMEQVNSARRPIKAFFWSSENMGGSVGLLVIAVPGIVSLPLGLEFAPKGRVA